jgi:gamma-glutamyltranspeptidase
VAATGDNSARRHHRPSREYGSSHLKWGVDQVIQDNCGLGIPTRQPSDDLLSRTENHPNVVAPYKRPRTTLSPSLATVGARPWMAFGSMGGDQQDQWQLQFFLNRVVFGMTVQEAIEAPKFSSDHFPGFFAPHDRFPNKVRLETRMSSRRHAQRRRGAQAGDGKADGVQRHR